MGHRGHQGIFAVFVSQERIRENGPQGNDISQERERQRKAWKVCLTLTFAQWWLYSVRKHVRYVTDGVREERRIGSGVTSEKIRPVYYQCALHPVEMDCDATWEERVYLFLLPSTVH